MFKSSLIDAKYDKIRIDIALVKLNLVESRQKASAIIMLGDVFLDEKKIDKAGYIVRSGSVIKIKTKAHSWVSRGGIKLNYAITKFKIDVKNKKCIDLGCSTGGFTHVLLNKGAKKILCFDVGYGQLAWKIRNNKRVKVFEKFNARNISISVTEKKQDILVCDVSFISIKKIIPVCLDVMKNDSILLILIKPQFEAGRKHIEKGGIILNPKIHEKVCNDIKHWFETELKKNIIGIIESPIKGQKGNKEFFICVSNKKS